MCCNLKGFGVDFLGRGFEWLDMDITEGFTTKDFELEFH